MPGSRADHHCGRPPGIGRTSIRARGSTCWAKPVDDIALLDDIGEPGWLSRGMVTSCAGGAAGHALIAAIVEGRGRGRWGQGRRLVGRVAVRGRRGAVLAVLVLLGRFAGVLAARELLGDFPTELLHFWTIQACPGSKYFRSAPVLLPVPCRSALSDSRNNDGRERQGLGCFGCAGSARRGREDSDLSGAKSRTKKEEYEEAGRALTAPAGERGKRSVAVRSVVVSS